MPATSREKLDRLEHEARQARATVSSQLAQVRHRLEPQELKHQAEGLKDQLVHRAREKSSEFIEDRKRRIKQTVLDAAMNNPAPTLALGTIVAWALWRRISQIPAPILLVGAGGLLGLMQRNDGSSRGEDRWPYDAAHGYARPEEHRTYAADYRYGQPEGDRTYAAEARSAQPQEQWRAGEERSGGTLSSIAEPAKGVADRARAAADRAREMAADAGTRISDAGSRISEATTRAGSTVADMAGRTAAGISRAAGDVTTTAGDLGRQARTQFSELFERHPLVLGGLGLALGAAIAYALRPTEIEARWVGETSDSFKRRAREMAEEHLHRGQAIAERAYEAARDEAREQGVSPEVGREAAAEIGRKARAVADRATEAARETWNADTTV